MSQPIVDSQQENQVRIKREKVRFSSFLIVAIILGIIFHFINENQQAVKQELLQVSTKKVSANAGGSGADHSRFESLQIDFKTPEEVTAACLECHNRSGKEIMKTTHWTWSREYTNENGETIQLGKKNILNNFCIGVQSNEPRCTSCHIGYGWKDNQFDFENEKQIDCLICHDQTGTYKKFPTAAGYPVSEEKSADGIIYSVPDYREIAQQVGKPGRTNCGACHFSGGGGNNVKHGDMANELADVTRDIDVHMASDGGDLSCIDCHKSKKHNIQGSLYSIASMPSAQIGCERCHSAAPHSNAILNRHFRKVSCQTCHIPTYAKASSTKMYWDWSTAGEKKEDGSMKVVKDSLGNTIYHTMKGSFVWANHVEPEYAWFNGHANHYVLGDVVNPQDTVQLNSLQGNWSDPDARIVPLKVHRGKIPFDLINRQLINPHLYGNDSTSYWKNFDWDKAAQSGMESAGLNYSGEIGFIESEMYWPINHMVAPVEESLSCTECHARNGRLSQLKDFYLPGRDYHALLDQVGFGIIAASLLFMLIHFLISNRKS